MSKKVCVTGSLGLLGKSTVQVFEEKGWTVIGIDSNIRSELFGTPKKETARVGEIEMDIRDEIAIENLFKTHKFDAVIHCAAQPSHDWAKNDPLKDFDINARGTLILLEATRKHCPDAVFVHVSTDKVYGENMKFELKEEDTRYTPISIRGRAGFDEDMSIDYTKRSLFGCSKTAADIYAQEYGRYFGMKTGIFRPGCITGKDHEGAEYHGFLAYLAKCVKEEKLYRIFGYKGKQVRDQIHAYDLAMAFWHFVQKPHAGAVYNIGGGTERSVSVLEAIELLEARTGKKALTEYIPDIRSGDRQWDIHDVTKFKRDFPTWDYTYSLDDIITDLV